MKSKMSNISVIIPVHKFDETIEGYLDKAIESINNQENIEYKPKIYIVCPADLTISKQYDGVSVILNNGKTDYQSQVNFAVDKIETDYFTVLEFDDELSTTYFKNSDKFIESYPEIDVLLNMIIEVNENNEGIKLTNETVWSQQFVGENGEMGYLNANALKQYTDFKLSGAVIKKSEFINVGKYKSNIKLTFMYEFLLRALNNACKIYSMPKIGYKHLANRVDSLFDEYNKNMPMAERKFWFDTAANEAHFMTDRIIDTSKLGENTAS